MNNYELNIISHHNEFKNKKLRKYHVDGMDTVGVYGNEPFEIVFKNSSPTNVEVKLSLDGTDILTGNPATTDNSGTMYMVKAYDELKLKAWQETTNGGAAFMFTNTNNSVAAHTHGDLSSRGIIAAAVYVEGENNYDTWKKSFDYEKCYPASLSINDSEYESLNIDLHSNSEKNLIFDKSILRNAPAIGAGANVIQKVAYVPGFKKPELSKILNIRYLWWDDLKEKLYSNSRFQSLNDAGFPGNKEMKIMSIGTTPRIGSDKPTPKSPIYYRV